jgi:hypothetical protein
LTGAADHLSPYWAIAVPCVVGVGLGALLSLVLGEPAEHPGRQYCWREVMRRPVDPAHPHRTV